MKPYIQSVIDTLLSQHDQFVAAAQERLQKRRASIEAAIRVADEQGELIERKHERSLRESTSAAWTSDLQSLHAERARKNEEARARFVAALDRIPIDSSAHPLDTLSIEAALNAIDKEISKYHEALSIKRRQTEFSGDYGEVDNEKWIKEILRFINKNPGVSQALSQLHQISEEFGLDVNWGSIVTQLVNELVKPAATLPDVAPSDGSAFEQACLLMLHNSDWSATLTPPSGDQGVDILAKKNDISVAIQCKNYQVPVGNGAVQEIYAGKSFYEADVAVVVSLSGYTPSASQLAKKLRVLLIDQTSLGALEDLL